MHCSQYVPVVKVSRCTARQNFQLLHHPNIMWNAFSVIEIATVLSSFVSSRRNKALRSWDNEIVRANAITAASVIVTRSQSWNEDAQFRHGENRIQRHLGKVIISPSLKRRVLFARFNTFLKKKRKRKKKETCKRRHFREPRRLSFGHRSLARTLCTSVPFGFFSGGRIARLKW